MVSIGHNGSGKTTIIKCLTGIYKPDQGTVTLDGKTVYENTAVKEKIGYVADSNHMFSSYKVKKNGGFIQEFVSGFFQR